MKHFLQSLQLFGFKSFADRTTLDFRYPLIALVGPNGCGKSNVVDAIRWVLGESSIRSMRGFKMEDIIFMGSESRKATQLAEVCIQLNNESAIIPVDHNELAIRRRLFRNGESEFTLNGKPILLRELRSLLHDTGIGMLSYSILQQGKIDQILSTKPEDRRAYFEESAGITGHKLRWRETEKKLVKTRENLSIIGNTLKTMHRQRESLQVQADKAAQYRKLSDEVFDIEVQMELSELHELSKRQHRLSEEKEKLEAKHRKLEEEILIQDTRADEISVSIAHLGAVLAEVEKKRASQAIVDARREEQHRLLSAQLQELQQRCNTLAKRVEEQEVQETEIAAHIDAQAALLRREEAEAVQGLKVQKDLEIQLKDSQEKEQNYKKQQVSCNTALRSEREMQKSIRIELTQLAEKLIIFIDTSLPVHDVALQKDAEKKLDSAMTCLRDMFCVYEKDIPEKDMQHMLGQLRSNFSLLEEALEQYRELLPNLVAQLTAPEGLLTQKHDLEEKAKASQEKEEALQIELSQLEAQRNTLNLALQAQREEQQKLQMQSIRASERKQRYREQIQHAESQKERAELRRKKIVQDMQEYERSIAKLRKRFSENSEVRSNEIIKELRVKEEESRKELHARKNLQTKCREAQSGLQQSSQRLAQKMQEIAIKQAQITTQIQSIKDRFQRKHMRQLDDYGYDARTRKELHTARSMLDKERSTLGSINFLAAEQFAELMKEYELLQKQHHDVSESLHELEKLMHHAANEATHIFHAHMQRIQKEFSEVFRTLFRGGKASVMLEDEKNILESGIEIMVQPPGKKLENISQLSGGERTLSAIALMLASFLIRPAPFCILDEVDATLDAENTQRFVQQLMKYAPRTQFIVVTHNILTTAAMDGAVGITMQEPGVSTVTSVALQEEDRVYS